MPARFWQARFWRGYGTTLRPYLFFVSGAGGLLGVALVPGAAPVRQAVTFAVLFVAYGLGQALTDVFQTDTDSLSSPYRPLVRGEILRRDVLGVSLGGLVLGGLALGILSPPTLVLWALAVIGLATYTPLKRRWWGGPAWNSAIVALLPAMGSLGGGASARAALASRPLVMAMGSVFFSYAVFVLIGYLKDVEADRATGYETVAVRFGRRAAVAGSALAAAAAMAFSCRLVWSGWEGTAAALGGALARLPGAVALLLWLWGSLALVLAHVVGWNVARDDEAHGAVALSVRGFVALHLGEVGWLRPGWALPSALLVVLFELALALRPSRSQI